MFKVQDMSTEDLLVTRVAINTELSKRQEVKQQDKLVVYSHGCKDSSNHHTHKYKHWSKLVHLRCV